ncbi:polysaccharide pyruvyl transferase family protein [Colwellia sp. RE-S-Sl-9]
MSKFFFKIKTQYENLGDALINRQLLKLMKDSGEVYIDASHVPDGFLDKINIKEETGCYLLMSFLFYFKLLYLALIKREIVYLFLNPGGYGGEISNSSYFKKNISYLISRFFSICGVRICHIGISYSDLGIRHAKILSKVTKNLYFHAVRDQISWDCAKNNGVFVNQILPDLALNLKTDFEYKERPQDYFISIRDSKESDYFDNVLCFINEVNRTQEIITTGFQVEFDKEVNNSLIQNSDVNDKSTLSLTSSLDENVAFYSTCKYVLSNRLHVLLLALSAGAIPIAVINRKENAKIVGIFESLDLSHCLIDSSEVSLQKIKSMSIDTEKLKLKFKESSQLLQQFFESLD